MKKTYIVTLTDEERQTCRELISTGKSSTWLGKALALTGRKASAKTLSHARILLKADVSDDRPRRTDEEIAAEVQAGSATVERIRKQFVEEGFEAALSRRKSRRVYKRKLDGRGEAYLIALSCQPPPEGYARWTLQLLADKLVELEIVDTLSRETVRDVLKKRLSSRAG